MIPKVIHYCWFGGNEKSDLVKKCINSWKQQCPDYEIKEWNESNYDINSSEYTKYAYEKKMWAFVSDYARVDIVNKYGGFYLDTDVELIKSLDELSSNQIYFGIEKSTHKISTGLGFGSEKKQKILEDILQYYNNQIVKIKKEEASFIACPIIETKFISDYGFNGHDELQLCDNIQLYPSDFLSPKDPLTGKILITDRTYSIHHFDASWLKKGKFYKIKLRFSKQLSKLRTIIVAIIGEKNFEKIRKNKL